MPKGPKTSKAQGARAPAKRKSWKRARHEDRKLERREDILATAWELFHERSYSEITMDQVAKRAGLAKGTLYLYFATKEELFLALQERQILGWLALAERELQSLTEPGDPAEIARKVTGTLERHPALARLTGILHSILEQNVNFEAALEFKRKLLPCMAAVASQLERLLPGFRKGDGMRVLLLTHVLISGIWQLSDPAPVVREIHSRMGMEPFRVDFLAELQTALSALLVGMNSKN